MKLNHIKACLNKFEFTLFKVHFLMYIIGPDISFFAIVNLFSFRRPLKEKMMYFTAFGYEYHSTSCPLFLNQSSS